MLKFLKRFRKPKYTWSSAASFKMLTQVHILINSGRYDEARLLIARGQASFPDDDIWFKWEEKNEIL
jgi:hypothetical protein